MHLYAKVTFTIFTLLLISCNHTIKSEEKYYEWLNDASNNVKQEKNVNGFTLSLKYLPSELMAYNEYMSAIEIGEKPNKDSLLKSYDNSLTFLLTIKEEDGRDIMYYKTYTEEMYKQRFMDMNFGLGEYLWVDADSIKYHPTLYLMETTYDLKNSRIFYIVFSDTEEAQGIYNLEKLDIVFNDIFFETGISHFIFSTHDINKVPKIGFWQE